MKKSRTKKVTRISAATLVLILALAMNTFAFASPAMTFEEAKEYLESYNVTQMNSLGKRYTTQYVFHSEQDLDRAAAYIVENGLDEFNSALDNAIAEASENDLEAVLPQKRTVTPSAVEKAVSGDGTHYVYAIEGGLASFDTLGAIAYSVELSYRVTVKDGKFTQLNNISFDIPAIGPAGSWGEASFSSYCIDEHCGVTASYVITKTLEVGIEGFSFEIKSETDEDVFSLLAYID